jgi:hypothetical protein
MMHGLAIPKFKNCVCLHFQVKRKKKKKDLFGPPETTSLAPLRHVFGPQKDEE